MGRKAKSPYIQLNLGDRFLNLSERGQKAIMESRLGHFGDKIFPLIDADSFMVLYSENGRGPYYLQGLVGAYLIMRMLHITPDELLLRIDSDIAIQYALHTTSMKTQPFSRRNLFYFMARLDAYESEKGIVRFYSGEKIKSLDDLNETIKEPALEFAYAVRKSYPCKFSKILKNTDCKE